jgi:rubrerythrin
MAQIDRSDPVAMVRENAQPHFYPDTSAELPLSRYRCTRCGYGASCRIAPERCPMCGGSVWDFEHGDHSRSLGPTASGQSD